MEGQSNGKKRERDESEDSDLDSPEVKRLREDLLAGFLDDTEPVAATQDLDSVMKIFQDEISAAAASPLPVVDLKSDSGESQPELGYLLEASDDELGLPPSSAKSDEEKEETTELVRVSSDSSGIGEFWGFEDQIPSYDSFDLDPEAVYGHSAATSAAAEYVALDGLFEYSDAYFYASECS